MKTTPLSEEGAFLLMTIGLFATGHWIGGLVTVVLFATLVILDAR